MPAAAPSNDAGRLLGATQDLLERLYGVSAPEPAAAFLLLDPEVARVLQGAGWQAADESLLVCETDGDLELSLFIDRDVITRLLKSPPHTDLGAHNLADFWSLLEGVSHFVYLTWNAARSRSVTPLELELQAEVDKYAASLWMWQQQRGGAPRGLHNLLFDRTRIDDSLPPDLKQRYHDANRFAGRYCLSIERTFLKRRERGIVDELRSFYREDRSGKLARIDLA